MVLLKRCVIMTLLTLSFSSSNAAVTSYSFEADFLTALGSADLITENFDALPADEIIDNGITINDITYNYIPLDDGPFSIMIDDEFDSTSIFNYLSSNDGSGGFIGGDSITFSFDQPLFAFGLYVISADLIVANDFTLTTNNGQSVGNSANPDSDVFLFDGDAFFIGLIEDDFSQGFTSITLSSLDEGFLFTIDDITAAPVPLPAAFWLFGIAFISLIGIKRRN